MHWINVRPDGGHAWLETLRFNCSTFDDAATLSLSFVFQSRVGLVWPEAHKDMMIW
jgi:hypothetical protein